jgi:hypothetical protein
MRLLALLLAVAVVASARPSAQSPAPTQDWVLVRSVSDEQGGSLQFVVVPARRQRDRAHYETIANMICGPRAACAVHFWTDRRHVPTSAWMSGPGLSRMTAQYERSPSYQAGLLRLACWLYGSKPEAERDNCFYLPGAKTHWNQAGGATPRR